MNIFIISFITFCVAGYLLCHYIEKRKRNAMIKEPTRKILELISEGRFSVEKVTDNGRVSYKLKDLVTEKITTFVYLYTLESIVWAAYGDLSWMNHVEREEVGELILKISSQEEEIKKNTQEKEKQKENDKLRQEAMKIYK